MIKKRIQSTPFFLTTLLAVVLFASCSAGQSIKFSKRPVQNNSKIAVLIDADSTMKNSVLQKLKSSGFRVHDAEGIFAKLDTEREKNKFIRLESSNLPVSKRTVNNLFKMLVYKTEIQKAEKLGEMRNKFDVQYLVLMTFSDWENTSWARAIDLRSNELIWVDNHPTGPGDNVETVTEYFISSMTGGK